MWSPENRNITSFAHTYYEIANKITPNFDSKSFFMERKMRIVQKTEIWKRKYNRQTYAKNSESLIIKNF